MPGACHTEFLNISQPQTIQQKPHSNIPRKISSTDTRPISLLWEQNFHNRLQELILFYDHALQFPCHRMGLKFPRHCVGISFPCHYMGMKFPQNGMGMKFPQTICRNCILFIILRPGLPSICLKCQKCQNYSGVVCFNQSSFMNFQHECRVIQAGQPKLSTICTLQSHVVNINMVTPS